MQNSIKRVALFLLMLFSLSNCIYAQLITYDAPGGSALNTDFTVKVRQKEKTWQSIATYLATVARMENGRKMSEKTSFAYFDFSGEVEVSVSYNKGKVNSALVRPLSEGSARVKGNSIIFSLSRPGNFSIEVNGDVFHNLHLFANPLETYNPLASDTSVIYYGPGIHKVGIVNLKSNQTVYIAGGAQVNGSFKMNRVQNVRIFGRGVIFHPEGPIDMVLSRNIHIEGVIMANTLRNTANIAESDSINIKNLKSFSDARWGDGIDIYCSSNVLIDGVFMRNSHDCIAIYGHRGRYYGNVKNVIVQNSTLWADVAHPIFIGTHGDPAHPDTLSNIKFTNIDILDHNEAQLDYQGCMAINAGDANFVKDVRFENIRIGNIRRGQLVNLRVMYNRKYNTAPGRGIENIYFKDISYIGNNANLAVFTGYDEARGIKNIIFENLKINGKVISDDMPDKPGWYKTGDMANIFVGEHVEGLNFIKSKNP